MAFLLLLALICSASFAFITWSKSMSSRVLSIAFAFLAISLVAQLVLGYRLSESWAKLFYFARGMMVVVTFAAALFLELFPKHSAAKYAPQGLLVIGLLGFTLIGATQLSRAVDWFQVSVPLYAQIGDLLATNRPTRWLATGLTGLGVAAFFAGALYAALRHKASLAGSLAIITGTALLLAPLVWQPRIADPSFFVGEAIVPFLMFTGFKLVGKR